MKALDCSSRLTPATRVRADLMSGMMAMARGSRAPTPEAVGSARLRNAQEMRVRATLLE